jgi:predicted transcriptional regulator
MRFSAMEKKNRTHYNTTLDADLLKRLKILAVEENKRHNDLLEEAIRDLLKKYKTCDKS